MSQQTSAIEVYTVQGREETYSASLAPQEEGGYAAVILGYGKREEGYLSRELFPSVEEGKKFLEDFKDENNESLMDGKLSKLKSVRRDFINLTKQSFIDTLRMRLT